jgi:hypothetical protein
VDAPGKTGQVLPVLAMGDELPAPAAAPAHDATHLVTDTCRIADPLTSRPATALEPTVVTVVTVVGLPRPDASLSRAVFTLADGPGGQRWWRRLP